MTDTSSRAAAAPAAPRPVRDLADRYVGSLAGLNPLLATRLGLRRDQDRLPDLAPAGQEARDDLARETLAGLAAILREAPGTDDDERRCGRLLRERLEAGLASSAAGEHLRDMRNIFGPVSRVRSTFLLMPSRTADDWAVIARRMARVPEAFAGYQASLAEGARQGLLAAPRQGRTLVSQLDAWAAAAGGRGWFAGFCDAAGVPPALRADLDRAAADAQTAAAGLRGWLCDDYLPRAGETPDAVGEERYRVGARQWTGADLDPAAEYAWGWSEYQRLSAEMAQQARVVLPGAGPREARRYLDAHGEAVEGVPEIRQRLQRLMDDTIAELCPAQFAFRNRCGGWKRASRRKAAPPRPTTRRRRWTSPGPGAPGCLPSARPGSRSGIWSAPGITRGYPGTTCSSRSGPACQTGCRCSRPPPGR